MKKKHIILALTTGLMLALTFYAAAQDILINIVGGDRPTIAIPYFRGSGEAEKFMSSFNETLNDEIEGAGVLKLVARSMMPRGNPQVPQDFKPAGNTGNGGGYWITDWSSPPVNAKYLAFGYTGIQEDRLVLFGWLYDVTQPLANAQVIGKLYFGPVTADGAKQVAREFAADILGQFGAKSLAGSKIYFVSNRTGEKQIWVMDYDGSNQRPFAQYRELCTMPSVSVDGSKIAFTRFTPNGPQIMIHSSEGRRLPFLNPPGSLNATLSFSPDGSKVVFASKVGGFAQLHIANSDGSGLRRLSDTRAIEVEPKINPKTGADLVFVSGRSGPQQIYKMNMDGADVVRLTSGEGQASNPSWHPDGRLIAFSWTRGYEPGNWNVFVMDVTTQKYLQLTSGRGRNENPTWAPDGRHIVFASTRGGTMQIYTMLADGTNVRRLTSAGRNEMPVWSR
jgi:TolB protein